MQRSLTQAVVPDSRRAAPGSALWRCRRAGLPHGRRPDLRHGGL